jgi:hypothetical protein
LLLYSTYLPLGVSNGLHASKTFSWHHQQQQDFFGAIAGKEVEDFCEGSFSHTHPLLCLLFCFALFYLHRFYQKFKKLESLVVAIYLF